MSPERLPNVSRTSLVRLSYVSRTSPVRLSYVSRTPAAEICGGLRAFIQKKRTENVPIRPFRLAAVFGRDSRTRTYDLSHVKRAL